MRTVKVVIEASVAGAIANVKAFEGTVKDLGSELDRAAAKHPERLNKIASVTGKLGIGMAVAFGAITKASMDFDRQMSHVVAVSDDGAKSLDGFRNAALAAGRDTAFTATQAGQAEEELAKAGVSTADILGGALTGALNLAAAGTIDLGEAASIAAQAMTEFGLSGKDVGHIADVLTAGANKSTADVSGLGEALGQVGGIAHQTGLSLEDTVGVLARFTQGGMAGEEAGTTLKQTLLQLQAPSKEAADLMKQLGINIYDTHGQFIGITAIAQNLKDSLGGLDEAQRNAALGTLFGARAIRGATILYQEGAAGIQQWINSVNDQGAASETARQKLDNLSGDLHKLLGSLQAVAIESSGGTNAGLRLLAQGAEKTLNAFLGLPKPVQETATVLLGIGAVSLLATSGLLKIKTTVTGAMEALRDLGPVGQKAAAGLSAVGSIGAKLGIAGIAIFGIVEGYKALGEWVSKKYGPVHHDLSQLTSDLQRFAQVGQASGLMAQVYGESLTKLADAMTHVAQTQAFLDAHPPQIKRGGPFAGSKIDQLSPGDRKAFEQYKTNINELDKSLADLASHGNAQQAKMSFDMITESLLRQGVPMSQIVSMFPQYAKAASDAAVANSQLGQGFGNTVQNLSTMTKGLQDAIDHGETLISVFKQLNGANLDLLDATINEKQALADLTEKWTKHADALNLDTQAGRDNMHLVEAAIKGAADAAQAKFNESGSVEQATAVYQAYIAALRMALHNLGLSDAAINQIINDYGRMPPAVTTQVNTPGLSNAVSQAERANNAMDRLNGRNVTTTITTISRNVYVTDYQTYRAGERMAHGGIRRAATGLIIPPSDPGTVLAGEPQTGGEVLTPLKGISKSQAMSLSQYVGNAYGFNVVPRGGGSDDLVAELRALRRELRAAGGDIVLEMDGQRLGRAMARKANLMSRSR